MCPTNFCHPNDDTCTRTSCVPDSLRGFHRVDVTFREVPLARGSAEVPACAGHEVLGFVRLDRGTECFTALENASADRGETRAAFFTLSSSPRRGAVEKRGRFLPTAPAPTKPLTPLSRLPLPQHWQRLRSAFRRSSPALHEPSRSRLCLREEEAKVVVTTCS